MDLLKEFGKKKPWVHNVNSKNMKLNNNVIKVFFFLKLHKGEHINIFNVKKNEKCELVSNHFIEK